MRPETEAGAPEARGRGCHCPGDGFQVRPPPHGPESRTPWRPWTLTSRGAQLTPTGSPGRLEPGGDQQALGSKGAFGFQHPVRNVKDALLDSWTPSAVHPECVSVALSTHFQAPGVPAEFRGKGAGQLPGASHHSLLQRRRVRRL
ncbi:protein ripply3 isoform X4 [Oryctolagus cuniculus]|uniref:protein ripply3 isoform X4 n=1 Tax=Oryctolagus cuniculus TaxID=9986 RepID=UPI0038793094